MNATPKRSPVFWQLLEIAACAAYLLLLTVSFRQFAVLPVVTVSMVVSALVALIAGRPLIRSIAIVAFAFPVLALINYYQQSRPSPATPIPSQNPSSQAPKQ